MSKDSCINGSNKEEMKPEEKAPEPETEKVGDVVPEASPTVTKDETPEPIPALLEPVLDDKVEERTMPILEKCDAPVLTEETVENKKFSPSPPGIKKLDTTPPAVEAVVPSLPSIPTLPPLPTLPVEEKRFEDPIVKAADKRPEESYAKPATVKEIEKSPPVLENKKEERSRLNEEKREELKHVKATVEVDLTQDDSPPPPPPPHPLQMHPPRLEPVDIRDHSIKEPSPKKVEHVSKSDRPREPQSVIPTQSKERRSPMEEKRREDRIDEVHSLKHEMSSSIYGGSENTRTSASTSAGPRTLSGASLGTRTPPVVSRTRTPPVTIRTPPVQGGMHPMVYSSGCDVDVSPSSHMSAVDQPVEMSAGGHPYSDCAQQAVAAAALHHRSVPASVHHMTSGHMVYHHQQQAVAAAAAAKAQAAAVASRAGKQQRQRTPPPPQQLRHQVPFDTSFLP